jgi:UDP-3-O-[3-hydroxymyristoyl] glucosamine N-acyltransferase
MRDPLAKKYTLKELATLTSSELVGDADHTICSVESLEEASSEDVSFLANPRYTKAMNRSKAGAVFISPSMPRPSGRNYLLCEDPSVAFQTAAALFLSSPYHQTGFTGIHETAVIHPSAVIEENVQLGPFVCVDQGARIAKDTKILSNVSIGAGVQIGEGCLIHSNVTIRERSFLGNRVVIQPGAVIGSCGFGFSTSADGIHTKLDQLGTVTIEDDVEIGANTTIDRARFKSTTIGKGTKIDNLVQIGHNINLGPHNLIVSQTGISGSVKTGRNVVMGGQCGIAGHLEIGSGVTIASRGGIRKNLMKPGAYGGAPILPLDEYIKQQVHSRNLSKHVKAIEELQKKVEELSALQIVEK